MNKITNISAFFLLIFAIWLYYNAPDQMDARFISISLWICLLSFLYYFLSAFRLFKYRYYIIPSSLFVIGYLIVGCQNYLLYCLGYNPLAHRYDLVWQSGRTVCMSSVLIAIGLLMFSAGYAMINKQPPKETTPNCVTNSGLQYYPAMFCVTVISFIIYLLSVSKDFWTGTYATEANSSLANFSYLIFWVTSICSCVIKQYSFYKNPDSKISIKAYVKSTGLWLSGMMFFVACGALISGDRGPFMNLALAYFGIYIIRRRFNIAVWAVAIIIAAFFFSFIGILRLAPDERLYDRIAHAATIQKQKAEMNSPLEGTQELANSIMCLHIITQEIPENYDYYYGWNFFYNGIAGLVPGLRTFLSNFVYTREPYNSSDYLITYLGLGPAMPYGLGTQIIADYYLDGGLIAVTLMMFLTGMSFAYMDKIITSNTYNLYFVTISLVFMIYAIYLSRGSFIIPMRFAFFCLLFLFLFRDRKKKGEELISNQPELHP